MMTPSDLYATVNDGKLSLTDQPDWMDGYTFGLVVMGNAGCMNSAARLSEVVCGVDWAWRVGYDNLAEMTHIEHGSIAHISLTPAHALTLCVLAIVKNGWDLHKLSQYGKFS